MDNGKKKGVVYCELCLKYNKFFFPENQATHAIFDENGKLDSILCQTHFWAIESMLKKENKIVKEF